MKSSIKERENSPFDKFGEDLGNNSDFEDDILNPRNFHLNLY